MRPSSGRATDARPEGAAGAALGGKSGLDWRKLSRVQPDKAKSIRAAAQVASAAHDSAVGVGLSILGGVAPGSYRGRTSPGVHGGYGGYGGYYNNPWNCGWGWSSGSSWWWGWNWTVCWGLYYPCWWWSTRPYYASWYCYYPAVATTIVYPSETRIVYADPLYSDTVYADPVVAQDRGTPVGEAAVAGVPAAAAPLTIVAQRYLELGDRAFREGRYTDAVQFYAKAVEFAPDQGGLYLVLSDALFAAGDYHYGAYAVRRALELDPGLVETQVDKHGFYAQPEAFDQQLATLERYVAEHPSDRDARLVLALNYLFASRAAEAAGVLGAPSALRSGDQAATLVLEQARARSPLAPR